MNKQDLIDLFDQFVNEFGLFYTFKEFIEKQGYTLSELGFKDE